MIKTKKWLLLTVCALCLFAALLCLMFAGSTAAYADTANVIRKSDGTENTDSELEWTYGAGEVISYSYRPEHGDTVYYTLSKDGQEQEKFAVVYIGDTEIFCEVKDGAADTTAVFKVNSLKAYLETLTTGEYTLTVTVPEGTAPDAHEHWWDSDAGEVTCGITYAEATQAVGLKVAAYEITEANLGDSTSTTAALKYSIQKPEVEYTGEDNNLPEVVLTLGDTVLELDVDYTLSSDTVNAGPAALTITGIGGFTGEVTVPNAYTITNGTNSVSDAYVVRWKHGQYDREVNLFTANVKWGAEDLYFAIATDTAGNYVAGLEEIQLDDGKVSADVAKLLNKLDAKKTYYLYAKVDGGDNYNAAEDYTQFEVVEITNTWTTTPNVVSWEWHGFDEKINVINAVPAFGNSVKFAIYQKTGEGNGAQDYTALKFGQKDTFQLEEDGTKGSKLPANVAAVLSELDAGTYYLFASVISDTANYTSINETFTPDALVPFRVLQATNYWTQIPKLSNWSYGGYDAQVNVISASSAHGSDGIKYSIYKQSGDNFGILNFGGTSTFELDAEGAVPEAVSEGLKKLSVGKYYLRAEVAATTNYTGIQEKVADYAALPSFEVIKAENSWSISPAINAWSEGNYTNEDNVPVAAAHYGVVRIVITDVDDPENVVYDSENNVNKLAEAGVGAYLLTATVAGTDDYAELTFDTIFHVFVPETAKVGIPWWLVLIIVLCSLAVLVFIFWLLHEKGVLQMLSGKTIVAMRTRATMDATIAAVRANKVAEEAKESVRLAEELDRLEAEKAEIEEDDSDEEGESILISQDEETGIATFVRYQKAFSVKLIQATDEAKDYYSQLKNILLSYKKVKSKLSKGYDAFNRGRTKLAKLVIRGKTLCLYLALDPDEFADSKYKVERSESKKFADVPCLYRIKSARRLKYAEELIAQMCEKLAIPQGVNKNEDYRPPYQSTEELMEKGLIKKIVYTRKIDGFNIGNKVESADVKAEGETELQEIAATESDAPVENGQNAEAQVEEPAAPEAEPAVAEENDPSVESDADDASENSTDGNKNNQGEE